MNNNVIDSYDYDPSELPYKVCQVGNIPKSCIEKIHDMVNEFIDKKMIVNERSFDKHSLVHIIKGVIKDNGIEISTVINRGCDGIRVLMYGNDKYHININMTRDDNNKNEYYISLDALDHTDDRILLNLSSDISSMLYSNQTDSEPSPREYVLLNDDAPSYDILKGNNKRHDQTFINIPISGISFRPPVEFHNCIFVNCIFDHMYFNATCMNCKFINCIFNYVRTEYDDEFIPWRIKGNTFDSCEFIQCNRLIQNPYFQATGNSIVGDYTITDSYYRYYENDDEIDLRELDDDNDDDIDLQYTQD